MRLWISPLKVIRYERGRERDLARDGLVGGLVVAALGAGGVDFLAQAGDDVDLVVFGYPGGRVRVEVAVEDDDLVKGALGRAWWRGY